MRELADYADLAHDVAINWRDQPLPGRKVDIGRSGRGENIAPSTRVCGTHYWSRHTATTSHGLGLGCACNRARRLQIERDNDKKVALTKAETG
jgi:hypothetical protein